MGKAKKYLALLTALALVIGTLALAGCGNNQSSDNSGSNSGSSNTSESSSASSYTLVTPGTFTVGSDTSFPPFESMNGSTPEGFDVDLAKAIADDLGLQLKYDTYKFDTLIPTLKAGGKFDVIMSAMTINDERKQEIDFSDPYIDSNQSIAVKKDSSFKSADDLKGKKIGVQSGTTGQQWAKDNLTGSTIVAFDDTLAAFAALQAGKVDAVVNDLPVSAALVKDESRGLKLIQEIPTGEQYGIGVAKSNPELLKAINASLAKLKSNGKYDEIYKKWFGETPKS